LRFDDSLDTVLAADTATPFGAQSAWRQLTDLIGRRRAAPGEEAIARLRAIRGQIPPPVRAASARSLAFANPPASLVQVFAEDDPGIAAPVLAVARLSELEWRAMIPDLPPASRALLRHRRDLPPGVRRALESYGASDFALPLPDGYEDVFDLPELSVIAEPSLAAEPRRAAAANDPASPFDGTGPFPIAELVARLDAYQRDHGDLDRPPLPLVSEAPVDHFCFETDATGTIRWVDGAPREPLIGVLLGAGSAQVDGVVTGAFRRRTSFADARMVIGGSSTAAGQWQLSATPGFDPASGRFTGYRGVARRPRVDERAEPIRAPRPAAEALRALVHELRTPTNAISGFAEMIEAQVLGPAPDIYRDRAATIRSNTRDLLDAIEDVDTAARLEQNALDLRPGTVEVASLLRRTNRDLKPLMHLRQSVFDFEFGPDGLSIAGDETAVGRIISRLMALAMGAAGIGERIAVRATTKRDKVKISILRPAAFAAYPGEKLLSLDSEDQGEGVSLLGIGFALRLARNLATELGGSLSIGEDRLTLRLPAALDRDVGQLSSN
jgi:signal transduction histidine kinase